MKLSKNFYLSEFACNDKDGTPVPVEYRDNAAHLASQLQIIRDFFNAKITINSGYRTLAYNTSIGGAKNSQHLTASAADIVVEGHSASEVHFAIEGLIRVGVLRNGGLGRYRTFCHYDIGRVRSWTGS